MVDAGLCPTLSFAQRNLRITSGPIQSTVAVILGYLYCKKASSILVLFTGSNKACSMPLNPLPGNKMW